MTEEPIDVPASSPREDMAAAVLLYLHARFPDAEVTSVTLHRPRKRKSHCKHGHPRTPENLYGDRQCRVCSRARRRNGTVTITKPFCAQGHPRTPETVGKRSECKVCKRLRARARDALRRHPRQRQTHCIRGHERTPENLYKGGECRTCALAKPRAKRKPRVVRVKAPVMCRADQHEMTDENRLGNGNCRACCTERRIASAAAMRAMKEFRAALTLTLAPTLAASPAAPAPTENRTLYQTELARVMAKRKAEADWLAATREERKARYEASTMPRSGRRRAVDPFKDLRIGREPTEDAA